MAIFAGSFASSHGPLIVRDWDTLAEPLRERFNRDFREVGRRIAAARPDILIVISPDHWVNFFLNNLPTVCIGVGAENDGPPEPFMRDFPYPTLVGDSAFGEHLLRVALKNGFDPSISHRLTLDHGFCIPLWRLELPELPRIVPVIINGLQEPMMSIGRCLSWGHLLANAIAAYPTDERIAVLGTGGLSHSIGETTMGDVDERFDRICLAALERGGDDDVVQTVERELEHTGNGSHEIRNWIIAHGAAGASRFDLIDYFPSPEVYIGCAFGAWDRAV